MLGVKVWRRLVGVCHRTVIEEIEFDEAAEAVVLRCRPRKLRKRRCGRCGRPAPGYDNGDGRRRWRALDLGELRAFIEAEAPRVACPVHGPTVIQVPWARHGAGHTYAFDDTVAWLAVHCSKTAVQHLARVSWRTVGNVVARVNADIDAKVDRFEGLARIGIDEISYKRGHKFLTVVVDHDTGRLVWAAAGRDEATLERFFGQLGADRCALITHVSADAAAWIARVVARRCPNAVQCADPFHVVRWATSALDEVRRTAWNEARGGPNQSRSNRSVKHPKVHPLKKVRWALWKNPGDLTARQQHQLTWLAGNHPDVFRAYRLKEALRYVFAVKGDEGKEALDAWISWARRSRLEPFVRLQRTIARHRSAIDASLDNHMSNALIESTNTKIRLITRVGYGFHGPEPLIALAQLALGGHCPNLPGRQ